MPLLGKLGNFVLGGGIWMNTQRPEWNDANNALVGHGISMVTLYHMRRYVDFVQRLLENQSGTVLMSREVSEWLGETAAALKVVRQELGEGPADGALRSSLLRALGGAASRYRETVYQGEGFSGVVQHDVSQIVEALADVLTVIDHGIQQNQREDGLYHAYNLLSVNGDVIELGRLDAMLEGQVAALSSGAISPGRAVDLLESLYRSDIYRDDVRTFMLYPDRDLPRFLEKNRIPSEDLLAIPQIESLLEVGRGRIVVKDSEGQYRFNADLKNANELGARLEQLEADVGDSIRVLREPLLALYEKVFHHKAFTGRAGTMFGFEGLGSVYWHMVSKLLLATQECYFAALQAGEAEPTCRRLGQLYYRIREGLGFNKAPGEYGAFPTDPYSHTPKHAGAQQPGMTGQVKEEILTRFGELGVHVDEGMVRFELGLLRAREFVESPAMLRFPDVKGQWQELHVPKAALAFSWCQVPFVYRLDDSVEPAIAVTLDDGSRVSVKGLTLPADLSTELFLRSGRVRQVEVVLRRSQLFRD